MEEEHQQADTLTCKHIAAGNGQTKTIPRRE
jgi:hypothetical protein